MSPEERQMLSDLFERVRGQASAPRDHDAEVLIADAIRAQPYAPYLLAQAVLLQEHALRAADQKLQDLQGQVSHLQDELSHAHAQPAPQSSGGFLGGLFGGGASSRPAPQQQPPGPSPWGQAPQQPGYPPQPQTGAPGPWGAPQPQQGGGFLKGALGAAAGVAGGMLLADTFKGLLGGGHGAASASSLLGGGMAPGSGAGETIVNNYYDDKKSAADDASDDDSDDDNADDQDYSDDFSDGGDDYGDDV